MIYSKKTTLSHPAVTAFPSIINCIDSILLNEGCDIVPTPFQGKDLKGIDGDELEKQYSISAGHGENNKAKSMDLIFGLNTSVFQFVEFKFRSKNFRHLDKSSFAEKVAGSSAALGTSTSISQTYYIIFKSNKVQQARNYLFRRHPTLDNKYKAVDVNQLYSMFFS